MCTYFLCFVGGGYVDSGVSDMILVMLVAVASVTVVLMSVAVAMYCFVRFCFPGGRRFQRDGFLLCARQHWNWSCLGGKVR